MSDIPPRQCDRCRHRGRFIKVAVFDAKTIESIDEAQLTCEERTVSCSVWTRSEEGENEMMKLCGGRGQDMDNNFLWGRYAPSAM